jgi:hypothetical protein
MKTPATKPLKLKELLLQSKEEQHLEDVEFRVELTKLQFQADLSETKRLLSNKTRERKTVLLNQNELSAAKLSKLDDEIEGLQKGIERTEQYISELF